jgi:hypothetical protein
MMVESKQNYRSYKKTISRIDQYRVLANRLRKTVRQSLEENSSGEALKPIVQRFAQSGALSSNAENYSTRLRRLKSFSINKYLELIAYEAGYDSWTAMGEGIDGRDNIDNAEDTELYKPGVSEFNLNVWCRTYSEAKEYLSTHKGFYLLQYKEKCFLVQAPHIEGLGLDPGDPDWEKIGRDWVKPKDQEAKSRLREKLRQAREPAKS